MTRTALLSTLHNLPTLVRLQCPQTLDSTSTHTHTAISCTDTGTSHDRGSNPCLTAYRHCFTGHDLWTGCTETLLSPSYFTIYLNETRQNPRPILFLLQISKENNILRKDNCTLIKSFRAIDWVT